MYKCKYFKITELVSPDTYNLKGDKCWRWFDPDLLKTLDALREKYGPMTVNSWPWNGDRKFSGFHLKGEYNRSEFSAHRHWRAFDVIFKDVTAEEVRKDILGFEPEVPGYFENKSDLPISELEYNISWFHFVVGTNVPDGKILCYEP